MFIGLLQQDRGPKLVNSVYGKCMSDKFYVDPCVWPFYGLLDQIWLAEVVADFPDHIVEESGGLSRLLGSVFRGIVGLQKIIQFNVDAEFILQVQPKII